MVIKPKVRGFICVTAHPDGCAKHVEEQVAYAEAHPLPAAPKRVLVVGASTGYGLASRIAATFGGGADTVGVFFERPSDRGRTATAGWYNNQAFERLAAARGRVAESINGDAFSDEIKDRTVACIRSALPGGQVDLVVYSLAAPKRTDPVTGVTHTSVLKPIGAPYTNKTVDFHKGEVSEVTIEPAADADIGETVKVMGGEDWERWMDKLLEAGVLADGCATVAYSYIGPALTYPVYKNGTIGKAKEDVERAARAVDAALSPLGGKAFVSVNKALVTQASAAIPVVPLYIALLFAAMKKRGTHEDCIHQMVRMLERMYAGGSRPDWSAVPVDDEGRMRLDDWEMDPAVQEEIARLWSDVTTENLPDCGDLEGYRADFYKLFGFGLGGVDYEADVAEF